MRRPRHSRSTWTSGNAAAASFPSEAVPARPPRRHWLLAAGGAAALLLLGVIVVVTTRNSSTDPASGGRRPSGSSPILEGSNEPEGSRPPLAKTGWHGWPVDAPKPAIAPFDAVQANKHQEEWAAYLKVPVEYTNSLGMKFRLIPPGEFLMGGTPKEIDEAIKLATEQLIWREVIPSEGPQHKVILTRPIYSGIHEVTQSEFERVIGKNPSNFSATGAGKEAVAGRDTTNHPVEMVSWNDAAEFCAKLSQQEQLKPFYFRATDTVTQLDGNGYRLPTEAEWEFACRAGTTTKFCFGDNDEDCPQAVWFSKNSGSRTHPVGKLNSNPFGLHDIHGNVFEWVQDGWEPTYYQWFQENPAIDPSAPATPTSDRVDRSGSWSFESAACRSAQRGHVPPSSQFNTLGFRVSLTVDAVRQALKVTGPAMPKAVAITPSAPAGWPANAPKPAIAPFDAAQAKQHQEEWAAYLKVPVEWENSIGMKFRLIPPGEYTMGILQEEAEAIADLSAPDSNHWRNMALSSAPAHKVRLTRPYYLGTTEVTQEQFQRISGTNPSHFAKTGTGHAQIKSEETSLHPVEKVHFLDVADFCNNLSQQENLKPIYSHSAEFVGPLEGTGYRVPTEAEWEYACRAGTMTTWFTGNDKSQVESVAWTRKNSGGTTQPVGCLRGNPFGLYDVHGNVWEWCEDRHHRNRYSRRGTDITIDPRHVEAGTARVQRGGDWSFDALVSQSGFRHSHDTTLVLPLTGFRVAISVDAVKQAKAAVAPNAAIKLDLTPPKPLGTWQMGPEPEWFNLAESNHLYSLKSSSVLPGIVERPRLMPGVKRWNVDTIWPRADSSNFRWSPDGQWIACNSRDGHVRLYDGKTMEFRRILPGVSLTNGAVDFSWRPDSSQLAIATDGGNASRIVTIDGELVWERTAEHCFSIAWNCAGTQFAAATLDAGKYCINIRDDKGKLVKRLSDDASAQVRTGGMAWSPDSRKVAGRHTDGKLRLWDVESGMAEVLVEGFGDNQYGHGVAWSEQDWLAVATGSEVRVYGPDRKLARQIPSQEFRLAWSRDGKQLLCGPSIIDRDSGDVVSRSPGAVAWSPDGRMVIRAMGTGNEACLVSPRLLSADQKSSVREAPAHYFPISSIAWSPEGKHLASASGWLAEPRLWTAHGVTRHAWNDKRAFSLAWSSDGAQLLAGPHGSSLWIASKDQIESPREFFKSDKIAWSHSTTPAWSKDGKFAVFGLDGGVVQVVDRTGQPVAAMKAEGQKFSFVAWNHALNRIVVTQQGQRLQLCDPDRGWTLRSVGDKLIPDWEVPVWRPDGEFLSVGGEWFDKEGTFLPDRKSSGPNAWRPDGKSYVSNRHIGVYGISTFDDQDVLRSKKWTNCSNNKFDFSPRGNLIVAGTEQSTITAWREADLQPHWHAVLLPDGKSATFSAAGELIGGMPEEIDQYLVYYVDRGDGKIETLTPPEFRKLLPADAVKVPVDPIDVAANSDVREILEATLIIQTPVERVRDLLTAR